MAYSIFQIEKEWFFPFMLMIIGARYLVFQSIYGMRVYWALGLILTTSCMICLTSGQPFYFGGIIGGVIEIIFGITIILIEMKDKSNSAS
ncbi:MAG: hypothetical protein RLN90_13000 [Balneolaceae bacterium]